MIRTAAVILVWAFIPANLSAQAPSAPSPASAIQVPSAQQSPATQPPASQASPQAKPQPAPPVQAPAPAAKQEKKDDSQGKQTSRILWVAPNFAAVSAGKQLPPLSAVEKFKLASQDSFDYTSFVWTGILAGQNFALRSYPELGHGAAGYGRYYWREFVDQVSGTYFTEAIVPALTREDPRYYTMEHGGFFRRFGYALSRVALTKTDSGGTAFNFSEIGGNGMEAALSNLYYPPEERGWTKTAENWGAQLESAALNNLVKEFWPDIRHDVLRQK